MGDRRNDWRICSWNLLSFAFPSARKTAPATISANDRKQKTFARSAGLPRHRDIKFFIIRTVKKLPAVSSAKPMPGDTYIGVLKVYTESANDSALDEIWVPISSSSSDQAMREADRLRVRLGIKSIGAEEPPSLSLSAPKGLRDRPLSDFFKALSDRLAAYKARRSA